jgi:hypothetical protein
MSFEQLAQHARDIEVLATRRMVLMSLRPDEKPPPLDQINPDSPGHIGEWYREFSPRFSMVPEMFRPFIEAPDPGDFGDVVGGLESVLGDLAVGDGSVDPIHHRSYDANTNLDPMVTVKDVLWDWSGRAAQEFYDNFVIHFPSIGRNQFNLALLLRGAIEAEQAIWQAVRHDIDDIAHKTLAALNNMDGCGRNQWAQGFTVAGAVVSAAAVPLTGGSSVAVALVGAGFTAVSQFPPEGSELELSGETPEAVINSMADSITVLTQHVQAQHDLIQRALDEALGLLAGDRPSFVFPRPELANMPPRDLTGPTGLGYAS